MPRVDEETRRERLNRILRLLLRHPLGLREAEIAQRMGLPRRTVNDYLWSGELTGKVYKEGVLWFADPEAVSITLRPVELTPEQAVTLYLAARLLVKLHDKRNEQAETALMKLADAICSDTDVGREVYQAVEELAQRPFESAYNKAFTTVVRGYIYKRKVWMVYKPLHGRPFECEFAPYLLEPSAIGYTIYAIGHSDPPGALRTRKIERVQEARLTREYFEVPPDFPGLEILRSAWSIIFGEELVEVKLRFSPREGSRDSLAPLGAGGADGGWGLHLDGTNRRFNRYHAMDSRLGCGCGGLGTARVAGKAGGRSQEAGEDIWVGGAPGFRGRRK